MKNALIELTEEWQIKWKQLQETISDRIRLEDYVGAYIAQHEASLLKRCIQDVFNLIKEHDTVRSEAKQTITRMVRMQQEFLKGFAVVNDAMEKAGNH